MSGTILLRVARGIPGGSTGPDGGGRAFTEHEVAWDELTTVLDALEAIRGASEPGLRYRHSCHHGSCGTCGAIVNGHEALMCLTRLADLAPGPVILEPLGSMDEVGDLAVDPSPLFSALPEGAGYLRTSEVAHRGQREDDPASPFVRFEACIECGLCVSACPAMPGRGDGTGAGAADGTPAAAFVGPAALAMADRDREETPGRLAASLAFAAGSGGVGACRRAFACSRACPQGVAPGRRIENLRKSLSGGNQGRKD
jgi:succinate dehydrogenase / fumarate reductase iron-sulfur subunit